MRHPRVKAALLFAVALAICVTGATGALASWSTGRGALTVPVRAGALGAGPRPTVSAGSDGVRVTWAATPPAQYRITRYFTKNANRAEAAGGPCAAPVSGDHCTDTGVSPGDWTYTVRPVLGAWTGAESAHSATVTVGSHGPRLAAADPTVTPGATIAATAASSPGATTPPTVTTPVVTTPAVTGTTAPPATTPPAPSAAGATDTPVG